MWGEGRTWALSPFLAHLHRDVWGEDTNPKLETDASSWIQHPACLLQGQGSAHTAQESPLAPAIPINRSPARPGPAFPSTFSFLCNCLWGRARAGMWEILPLPISWPHWLGVTHPGWEPTPHCSPTLPPPAAASVPRGLDKCSQGGKQNFWTECVHHVAHIPWVQLGPPLLLGSHRPPCKKVNSSNNFELQYLLLVFL